MSKGVQSPNNKILTLYLCITAYKTVLHSYGLESNPSTEDEENSDVELMEVIYKKIYQKML